MNPYKKALFAAGSGMELVRRLNLYKRITPQGVYRWGKSGVIPAAWIRLVAKVTNLSVNELVP